jgi:hypothetical protein
VLLLPPQDLLLRLRQEIQRMRQLFLLKEMR